ncbi:Z1 domain-containing protein [Cypionkella sp.]|uniref:Z1 domain-containing protein n=1 Tax=Cypionkella sp. TaxID=2811411 RepID=UPI002ABAE501|nr:Z1 domain-containing protein [Cypionkella sp.]MDZ4392987.1 Z1 domain-containing protein [Cypionkella sp.]
MTIIDQKAFDAVLSMAQKLLIVNAGEAGTAITPAMIEQQLDMLAMILPAQFAVIDRDTLVDELIRRASQRVGTNATLKDTGDHIDWLNADRKKGWNYWRRYSEYMETKIPWKALEALDGATDEVLEQLEDPLRQGAWDRRGLVVGHVQSGKTGNYTGLICKAADAGYKIIIVLAGLHNNLRSQTQIRLDEGFLGFATLANVDQLPPIGVGLIDTDHSTRPNYATTRSEKGDFNKKQAASLGVTPEQRPWLFVVKKNKTVLERLLFWIRNRAANYTDPVTGRKMVTNLPLLIIDDEADHGSVDTGENVVDEFGNADTEHNPTVLNKLIRSLLHHFSRKAYVGYTATPFANIFIHDKGTTDEHGPDLFPSSFITNLAAPSNYIGPGRVFGSTTSAPDSLTLVRALSEEEYAPWMPQKHKNGYRPTWRGEERIPDSMAEAVRSFILACAIRKLRGHGAKHSSMLIHVSRFTSVQSDVVTQVSAYVRMLKGRFTRGIDLVEIEDAMRAHYEQQFQPGMLRIRESLIPDERLADFAWDQVREVLPEVISDIKVREINGSAKDALDYADNEATGLKVIAIGGDKLARGLTLEGLCTSYFLRTARMYDTLMQMGRWFGYRDGYLDCCRLYTTNEMIEWFGHIADAAEELRQEFDNMVAAGATPKQFGLRVRSHSVLTVTSRSKMRNARPMHLTFSGDLLQTIVFLPRRKDAEANFDAGHSFLSSLGQSLTPEQQQHLPKASPNWKGHFWRGVSADHVTAFLRAYRTHGASFRVVSPLIAEFIDEMNKDGELTNWTVALIGASDSEVEIGGVKVNMMQRSGVQSEPIDRYSIKTLISPRDQAIDLTEAEWDAALAETRNSWRGDKERGQDAEPPNEPRGTAIRKVLGFGDAAKGLAPRRDRGLLMLYLLNPANCGVKELQDGPPVLAWAISFPGSPSDRRVSNADYMANSVMWGAMNDWVD